MYILRQHISKSFLFGAIFSTFGIAAFIAMPRTVVAVGTDFSTPGEAEARFAELSEEYNRVLEEYLKAVMKTDRAAYQIARNRLFEIFKEGRRALVQLERDAPYALARCAEYSGNFFDSLMSIRAEARAAMSQGLERAADEFYDRAISGAFLRAGNEAEAIKAMKDALSGAARDVWSDEAIGRLFADLSDDVDAPVPLTDAQSKEIGQITRDLTWDEVNAFLDSPEGEKFIKDFERDIAEGVKFRAEWEKGIASDKLRALEDVAELEVVAKARARLSAGNSKEFLTLVQTCPKCAPKGVLPEVLAFETLSYREKVNVFADKMRQEIVAAEIEYARVVADLDEKVGKDFARMVKNDSAMRNILREMSGRSKPVEGLSKGAVVAAVVVELIAKSAELGILNRNLDTAQLAFAQEMEFTTNWLRSANALRSRIFKLLEESCQTANFSAILTLAGQYNDLLDRAEASALKAMTWGGIVAQLTTGKIGLEQLDPTGIVSLFKILFNQTGELKEAPSIQAYSPLIAYADLTSLLDKFVYLKAVMANALQKKGEMCTTACVVKTAGACGDLGSTDVTAQQDGLAMLTYSGSGVESWGSINFPVSGIWPAPNNNRFTSNASCPLLSQTKSFCSASDLASSGMCEQSFTVALNKEMELTAPKADFGGPGGYTWPGLKKAVDPGYIGSRVRIQRTTERIDGQYAVGYDVTPYVEVKANTWNPGPSPVVLILSALSQRSGITLTDPYYLNQTCGNAVGCDSATTNNSALRIRIPFNNLGLDRNTEYRLEIRCEGSRPTDFSGYISAFSMRATIDGQPICASNDSSDPTPDVLSYTYVPAFGSAESVLEISSSVRAAYVVNPNTAALRTDGGPIMRRFNPILKFRFIPTGTMGGNGGGGGDGHAGTAF